MPQLDRLLSHVIAKGASGLRLEADKKPRLDLKTGQGMDLLPTPLPALMVDVLAGEVVPEDLKVAWQRDGRIEFDYDLGGQGFRMQLSRPMNAPLLVALH